MLGLVILALVTLAAGSVILSTMRLGIGPMPTSRRVRDAVLQLCPQGLTGTIYELGSGWGGLARALARHCPAARVIAVEASFVPWAFSALVQKVSPVPNLELQRGSFYTQPLGEADLMVCYLFTGGMTELGKRLRMKPGALLVSITFALPGRTAEETVRAKDLYASPVYRYRG